eukprot:SAG22_NODE_10436_length_536_cov_0.489703_2_plen_36_part_01
MFANRRLSNTCRWMLQEAARLANLADVEATAALDAR